MADTPTPTPDYLTVAETAAILRVGVGVIRRMIKHGEFPGSFLLRPGSNRSDWRIPRASVEQFITERIEQVAS